MTCPKCGWGKPKRGQKLCESCQIAARLEKK